MVELGNVVEEKMIGHTKVYICDDYCRDKSEKDVEEILKRIAEKVYFEFIK